MADELSFEIIWQDASLVEIRVTASNHNFAGSTDIYMNYKDLTVLANSLDGFPNNIKEKVTFFGGDRGADAYASLEFYCFSSSGHTAALIELEANSASNSRQEEKHKAQFEVQFESNALVPFVDGLRNMVNAEKGKAKLTGITPYTQNIF